MKTYFICVVMGLGTFVTLKASSPEPDETPFPSRPLSFFAYPTDLLLRGRPSQQQRDEALVHEFFRRLAARLQQRLEVAERT